MTEPENHKSLPRITTSANPDLNIRLNRYLELASKLVEQGCFPTPSAICPMLGMSSVAYYSWLSAYPEFKAAVQNLMISLEDELTNVMLSNARTSKGFQDRITLLKRLAPERWSPESRKDEQTPEEVISKLSSKMKEYIDAEVVPPKEITHENEP